MYRLQDVTTQQELAMLMQKMQRKDCYIGHGCILTVNDTSIAAKVIKNRIKETGYKEIYGEICSDLSHTKIKSAEQSLILDIVMDIFRDHTRFSWFSQSRKMMKRVLRNAKS